MPDEPEALGLLALMLFHDAAQRGARRRRRRPRGPGGAGPLALGRRRHRRGRTSGSTPPCGCAVPGPSRSRRPSRPATSRDVAETDWAEIAALYDRLFDMAPSAVIELNRAVAVSMSEGPEAGLALRRAASHPDGAAGLPPAAGGAGRHAAPPGPPCRGGRGLPAGPRPGRDRRRAALPGAAPGRGHGVASAGRAGLTGRDAVAIVSPGPPPAGGGPTDREREDGWTMLQDRVAIITGAGRGIGREHALLFASLGAKVVVNDLGGAVDGSGADVSAAQSVVDEITAAGGQAVANTDSVSSFAGAKAMVDQAVSTFGDLHVVVNNAGILRDRMLVSMSEQEFDDVIAVHLKGTFNLTRHAADVLARRGQGGHHHRSGHREHELGRRPARQRRPDQLLGGQGGHRRHDRRQRHGAEPLRRPGQLHRTGGPDPADHADAGDGRVDAAAPVRSRERLAARRRAGVRRPVPSTARSSASTAGPSGSTPDGRSPTRSTPTTAGPPRPWPRPWTSCPARSRSTARSPSSASTWGADGPADRGAVTPAGRPA